MCFKLLVLGLCFCKWPSLSFLQQLCPKDVFKGTQLGPKALALPYIFFFLRVCECVALVSCGHIPSSLPDEGLLATLASGLHPGICL